jgi:hypothetical protein
MKFWKWRRRQQEARQLWTPTSWLWSFSLVAVLALLAGCMGVPAVEAYARSEAKTWDIVEPEYLDLLHGRRTPSDFTSEQKSDRVLLLKSRRITINAALPKEPAR